jgi:hypothetical protein
MSLIGTFDGLNIVSLTCDMMPCVCSPSSIEIGAMEAVAVNQSPLACAIQTYDWQASGWSGQVGFLSMNRHSFDAWSASILSCRGQSNVFSLGDPKAILPKGPATGIPVVSGAGQTGYSLVSRGWVPNIISILLPGDLIQIGNRMYKLTAPANFDSGGNSTLSIWPNLRDAPADGTLIQTRNCNRLFRLAHNSANNFGTNVRLYRFGVTEAI